MRGIKTGWKAKPLTQLTGQFNILPGRLVKAIKRFWCLTPNSHHNPLLPPHTWTHWERKRGGVFTLWQQLRVFQASHQIETVGWLPIAALVPLETQAPPLFLARLSLGSDSTPHTLTTLSVLQPKASDPCVRWERTSSSQSPVLRSFVPLHLFIHLFPCIFLEVGVARFTASQLFFPLQFGKLESDQLRCLRGRHDPTNIGGVNHLGREERVWITTLSSTSYQRNSWLKMRWTS